MTRIGGRLDVLIALGACAAYLAALLAPVAVPPPVHLVAGAALVLFLPGYALLRGLGISAGDATSDAFLAVGTSIVITILLGLVLEIVPAFRLVADDWRPMMAFVAGALAALAFLAAPPTEAPARPRARPAAIAWGVVPVVLVAAAWLLSERSLTWVQPPGFTELWAVEGEAGGTVLGVRNREGEAKTYRLEVHPAPSAVESAWSVHLVDGEAWTRSLLVPPAAPGADAEVRLYRYGDAEPYRTVRLPSAPAGSARDGVD